MGHSVGGRLEGQQPTLKYSRWFQAPPALLRTALLTFAGMAEEPSSCRMLASEVLCAARRQPTPTC